MANQLEILMQLYMMNLIQQQQQQLIQQQTIQQQNVDTTTDLRSMLKKEHHQQKQHQSPTNCSSSTSASSCNSSNILNNSSDLSDFLIAQNNISVQQNYLSNQNDNYFNNLYPVNFSKSFLQSSTVTSTPTTTEKVARRTSSPISGHDNVRVNDDDQSAVAIEETDIDDEGQLYSTGASGSTNSGESSKLLAPILESTDSFSSPIMPFTPVTHENVLSSSASGQDLSVDNAKSLNVFADIEDPNFSQSNSNKASPSPSCSGNTEQKVTVKSENSLLNFDLLGVQSGAAGVDNILQNEESLKYLKKFSSYLECESFICRQDSIREHFHCYDQPCLGKVLNKRDEIIRHLKWHKKRKESLAYGFLRFSSSDDCSQSYGPGCIYNWKQTHYHCVEEGCPKVYVSTSDVQMHANYHRKNSEIIQEGFKRFRAIENCMTESCPFYEKKTSHYHCRRDNCQFTFKNKADMEKHKSYHLRDERLTQDGFKKILKTENCPFESCRFSTVCNHIHCVRENCNYILHSSSQLISHKRKHERLEGEQAYQNFKKAQKDSSEDDSPKSTVQADASTPLSSLTSESSSFQFLARKRGRPPKKIQLSSEAKKPKLETPEQSIMPSLLPTAPPFAPLLPQLSTASQFGVNSPNFQLTHLMAMFQLQNPLFYQNLYPGGLFGSGGASGVSGQPPQSSIFPTPISTPVQTYNKNEEKPKE